MSNAILPTPLPANSRKLDKRRYEVNLSRPHTSRDGSASWMVYRIARFTTETNARTWAEQTRPAGDRASLTFYTARDGWRGSWLGALLDSGWTV